MDTQRMAEDLGERIADLERKAYLAGRLDSAKALKEWGFKEAAKALADLDNEL